MQELLSILQDSEVANISTFEFLTSGAVQQLKDYLTGTDLLKGKGKAYVDSHKLLQRLHAFCEAATSQGKNGVAPMHSLVCHCSIVCCFLLILKHCCATHDAAAASAVLLDLG